MLKRASAIAIVLVAALTAAACQNGWKEQLRELVASRPGKLIVVFADVSRTISSGDWSIYREAFMPMVTEGNGVGAGDRIVLARISATSLTGFAPIADIYLPDTGIVLDDREEAELARRKLTAAFEEARKSEGSAWTHIIDAVSAAAQVFRNDPSRADRHIVILSDMLEESGDANFRLNLPDDEIAGGLIARLKEQGRLPDLQGVRIHVIGATASSAQSMAAVESFWRRFFDATGAELAPGGYARAGTAIRLK